MRELVQRLRLLQPIRRTDTVGATSTTSSLFFFSRMFCFYCLDSPGCLSFELVCRQLVVEVSLGAFARQPARPPLSFAKRRGRARVTGFAESSETPSAVSRESSHSTQNRESDGGRGITQNGRRRRIRGKIASSSSARTSHDGSLLLLALSEEYVRSISSSSGSGAMQLKGVELIYMVASPPCRAVLMCLKELKLEVDMKKIDMLNKGEHKQPWFVKMNPQHCVPTLNDNGFILWESRAIMAYLITKYGSEEDKERLLPSDPEARARVDKMWYFDNGCLYKSISDYYLPQLMSGESPEHQRANALKQNMDYLDIYLEESPYAAGETLTVADLSILASVTHLESVDFRYEGYTNVAAWVKKLKAELPYYNACNKEGVEMFQKWAKTRMNVKKTK